MERNVLRQVFRLLVPVFSLVLMLHPGTLRAQYLRHMDAFQMLRASEVYHVIGDSKGFLWFCTDRGLAKFDGHSTTFYSRQQGLGDDRIFKIYEDRQGRIWPFCYNGRYCFIDGDSIHNERNDPSLASLPHGIGYITCMAQDTAGNLSFGYSTRMIVRLRKGRKPELETHNPHYNGLIVTDREIRYAPRSSTTILATDRRHRMRTDTNGITVFLDERIVWQLNDSSLSHSTVIDMFMTADKLLLISTISGLEIISMQSGQRVRLLEDIRISSCYQDVAGNYWVTTPGNGIYMLQQEIGRIRRLPGFEGLDYRIVNDGRVVFIKDKMLYELVPGGDSIAAVPVVGDIPTYYNPVFRSGRLSLFHNTGTKYSLLIYPQERHVRNEKVIIGMPTEDKLFFKKVHQRGDTDLFMYGGHHQYQYLRRGNRLEFVDSLYFETRIDASSQQPRTREVYFIIAGALYRYDFEGRKAIPCMQDPRLRDVIEMVFAGDVLLLLTEERALYTVRPDRPGDSVKQIGLGFQPRSLSAATGNSVLLSSDAGDYLLRRDSGVWQTELVHYPFVSREYERLAFLGRFCLAKIDGGFYYFDTTLLNRRRVARRVYLNKLIVNDKEYRRQEIDIYNTSRINIQLSLGVLDFSDNPEGIRYRLLGAGDSSWQRTQATELAFVLRQAGFYELQFMPEGGPKDHPLLIRIRVHTPFFRSVGFLILCGLLALGLLAVVMYAVFRYRRRLFDRELAYLRLEHRAINALLNPHFIFNSINNIQGLINRSEKHEAAEYLAVLSRLIRQNLENLQFNLIPLEKELALIERYIMLQNLRFGNVLDLHIDLESPVLNEVHIPPLLVHTFVENAIVHGFRPGAKAFTIGISIRKEAGDYLEILIRDNGVGIPEPEVTSASGHRSMGISFNRKRLARLSEFYKLKQSITLRNLAAIGERGTEVRIVLFSGLRSLLERSRSTVD